MIAMRFAGSGMLHDFSMPRHTVTWREECLVFCCTLESKWHDSRVIHTRETLQR